MESMTSERYRRPKLDQQVAAAVEVARSAAEQDSGVFGVGDHLGVVAEAERVVTHWFACPHPGYRRWRWSVTLSRASRAKTVTVNEVVLLPGADVVGAPQWVPWEERIRPGDLGPGVLLATPDNDPRLEPGYVAGSLDLDPDEASSTRALITDLGLDRERVLSVDGRDRAAERWLSGDAGADNELSRQAPQTCASCGYLVRLRGSLGAIFGACTNEYSPSDASVVSVDHGCGAHSSVLEPARGVELTAPVWDTVSIDESLYD